MQSTYELQTSDFVDWDWGCCPAICIGSTEYPEAQNGAVRHKACSYRGPTFFFGGGRWTSNDIALYVWVCSNLCRTLLSTTSSLTPVGGLSMGLEHCPVGLSTVSKHDTLLITPIVSNIWVPPPYQCLRLNNCNWQLSYMHQLVLPRIIPHLMN